MSKPLLPTIAIFGAGLLGVAGIVGGQETGLGLARFSDAGELLLPPDIDRWIHLGSSLGSDYRQEPFDPARPGLIGVVQMEPAAYEYFLRNRRYGDGSMLLLSFYSVQTAAEPDLQGFVQDRLVQQEIHLIDRARFADEGRAFFVFARGADRAAAVPPGSECVACHRENGAFDASFTQFYPALRDLAAGAE